MKKLLYILIIIISLSSVSAAEINIPNNFGGGYAGENFYLTFTPSFGSGTLEDDVVRYIFISEYDTEVSIQIQSRDLMDTLIIKAGEYNYYEMPAPEAMMYTKSKTAEPIEETIYKKSGVHITAKDPVICYALLVGENKSEGYLAIPEQSLGRTYYSSSSSNFNNNDEINTSYTSIIATKDRTKIFITLGGSTSNITPDGVRIEETIDIILDKNDVYLLPVTGFQSDVTGTKIDADKPIAVFSGNVFSFLDQTSAKGNYTIEQDIPIDKIGKSYHVFPFGRSTLVPKAHIIGTEDNTTYSQNNTPESVIKLANGILGEGVKYLKLGENYQSFYYTSDKPVYVSEFEAASLKTTPFQINLSPSSQYAKKTDLYIPNDFQHKYFNIIFKMAGNTVPDDIKITSFINGEQTVSKLNNFEPEYIQKLNTDINDGRIWNVAMYRVEEGGIFSIESDDEIMVYVYGYNNTNAFGYSASGKIKPLLYSKDLLAPTFTYNKTETNVSGAVKDDPSTPFKDLSGMGSYFVFDKLSENIKFEIDDFTVGTTKSVNWQISVVDKKSSANATVIFVDYAGNDTVMTFAYTPPDIDAPAYSFIKNLLGDAEVKVWDESQEKLDICSGLKSIEVVVEESYNYEFISPEFEQGTKDTVTFNLHPMAIEEDGKLVLIVSDMADNNTTISIEHKPEREAPICILKDIDDTAKTMTIIDKPDDDELRGNLKTIEFVEDKSNNILFELTSFTPNTKQAKMTVSMVDKFQAAHAEVYASDIFNNDTTFVVDFPISDIKENTNSKLFNIYPNPTSDYLTINNKTNIIIEQIDIYNFSGVAVFSQNSRSLINYKINISTLPTGMYILKIIANNEIYKYKIIKE